MLKNTIIQGDALTTLKTLPDCCIQMCCTSPPYFGLRDYQVEGQIGLEETPEAYVARLVEVFREVRRILRSDGTCWINLGDSYAANRNYQVPDSKWRDVGNYMPRQVPAGLKPKDLIGIPWMTAFALRADGWYLRSDIIWNKPNCMPESVEDRPTKSHEYLFLLAKSERYYYDADAIRECFSADTYRNLGGIPARGKSPSSNAYPGQSQKLGGWSVGNPEQGRNKRSVWTIPSQPFSGALLLADYVGTDGRAYKVSQDCPFHGRTRGTHIQKTGGYDVQQDHASDRKSDTSNYRGQEQSSESDSIPSHEFQDLMNGNVHKQNLENTLDYRNVDGFDSDILQIDRGTAHTQEIPAYSSDSQYPLCSETAIDHSTQNNKTGHVPETNPAYTPSVESPSRIDDMSDLPLWSGQHDCNDESNIKQDGLGGHPLERTGYRNSGKSSVQNTFSAYAHGNTAKCTCQAVSIDHFATFPPKLIEPCILAGTSPRACEHCGSPWQRVTESTGHINKREIAHVPNNTPTKIDSTGWAPTRQSTDQWQPTCTCSNEGTGKCIVLDPFTGAGTTALVALQHNRNYLGIELNPEYVELAQKRIATIQPVLWEVSA